MTQNFKKFDFIDIHYHATPDLYERKYSVMQAGKHYQKLNGAVVLKSHLGSTAIQATIAQNEGLPVFASIVLNHISGAIHTRPIIQALAEYQPVIPSKLIVHLPTITGRQHHSKIQRNFVYPKLKNLITNPETIFNAKKKIKPELIDVFKLSRDYPIVLSTGHASKEEIYELLEACDKWRVPDLLLNQPANPLTGLTAEDLLKMTSYDFIWIEQTALTYLLGYQSTQDFSDVLRKLPKVIYSSDLGQTVQIDPSEWLKKTGEWFSDFNISTRRRVELCLHNPARILMM